MQSVNPVLVMEESDENEEFLRSLAKALVVRQPVLSWEVLLVPTASTLIDATRLITQAAEAYGK